jgi:hypothetical protein
MTKYYWLKGGFAAALIGLVYNFLPLVIIGNVGIRESSSSSYATSGVLSLPSMLARFIFGDDSSSFTHRILFAAIVIIVFFVLGSVAGWYYGRVIRNSDISKLQ